MIIWCKNFVGGNYWGKTTQQWTANRENPWRASIAMHKFDYLYIYTPWPCSVCLCTSSCLCGLLLCCCCCLLEMKTNMQSERRRKEPNRRTSSPMPGTKSSAIFGVCDQLSKLYSSKTLVENWIFCLFTNSGSWAKGIDGEIYVRRCPLLKAFTVHIH